MSSVAAKLDLRSLGPCGTTGRAPARWRHVVWIILENHGTASLTNPVSAPYLSSLGADCGVATNVQAVTHPSLPNYIALTAGSTLGVADSAGPDVHQLGGPTIFSQLGRGGWKVFAESMPAPCSRQNAGRYAVRHNPATYFVRLAAQCPDRDVPLPPRPWLGARLTMIVPDLVHGMHDSSVAEGDAFLAALVPKLLASPQYRAGGTAVFITVDEDEGTAANVVPTFVVAPTVRPGTTVTRRFTHYSLLRTTEQMLGVGLLRGAKSARGMRRAFNLAP